MTKPISVERATWLQERNKVLEYCIAKAHAQVMLFQSGGETYNQWRQALTEFSVERIKNTAELKVLQELQVMP